MIPYAAASLAGVAMRLSTATLPRVGADPDARRKVGRAAMVSWVRVSARTPPFAVVSMATVTAPQSTATLRPATAVPTILAPGRLPCLAVEIDLLPFAIIGTFRNEN